MRWHTLVALLLSCSTLFALFFFGAFGHSSALTTALRVPLANEAEAGAGPIDALQIESNIKAGKSAGVAEANGRGVQLFNLDPKAPFGDVVRFNRGSLSMVPHWIDPDAMKSSFFNYGVPRQYLGSGVMDLPIDEVPIVPDLLAFTALQLATPVRYLEIGVSVGKTLFQMMRVLGADSVVVAMDLEYINPVLANRLSEKSAVSTFLPQSGPRKGKPSGVDRYRGLSGQPFFYLATDEFDGTGWQHLTSLNVTFNMIFSDALHQPSALKMEWNKIVAKKLLPIDGDGAWYMLWDDLFDDMMGAFQEIVQNCQQRVGPDRTIYSRVLLVNGWIGQHQKIKHPVGIMSNRPLTFLNAVDRYISQTTQI